MHDPTHPFEELEVQPVSDEILASVLGGLGEEDGITNSCSTNTCSNGKLNTGLTSPAL